MHETLTIPIQLSCYEQLVTFTKEFTNEQTDRNVHLSFVLDPPIAELINQDLQRYDLPNATCFIIVKRCNLWDSSETATHIDCFTQDPSITHKVSIIVPIENCDKSPMFWYDGDYTVDLVETKTGETYPFIKWNDKPSFFHQELITCPTACNIDMPHSALSPEDGSYRTVLTFRLEGNPSFEEVCQKILTAQNS